MKKMNKERRNEHCSIIEGYQFNFASLKRLSLKISHTFLSNYLEFSQMKLVFLFVLYFFLRKSHTNRVGCCAVMHVAILSLSIEWL